jgi:4-hydroxybenzoate polyprenyltransferase
MTGNHRLAMAMGSVFFSYAVFVIIGYLKDVEADRATGYETIVVRFGRRVAVGASAACLATATAFSLALLTASRPVALDHLPTLISVLLWSWGLLALVGAHARGLLVTRDDEAHPAVALSVRGYVALHLGEIAWVRPGLAVPALGLLLLFELALALRPSRSQI